ncbi:ABC transporter substrate-binding protein [Salmonella bongori]|nr:ABC transporter substrate-binding protein [Salmonella bongori]
MHIIHHTSLLKTLPVDENLITPSQELLPGWTIPQWQDADETPLPKKTHPWHTIFPSSFIQWRNNFASTLRLSAVN